MEIGLQPDIPTYAGGLGVLAGDTLRSAADLDLPIVGVSLLYRAGYFTQAIDATGWQQESPASWQPRTHFEPLGVIAEVRLEGRRVRIAAWQYVIKGCNGGRVPVIFLDTDIPENSAPDRAITASLYAGDSRMRVLQEAVLGVGGVRALRAAGYTGLRTFHMNEGHAAFLALELVAEERRADPAESDESVLQYVKRCCVFTTHTPVGAGHDRFSPDLVASILEPELLTSFKAPATRDLLVQDGMVNMTHLAVSFSRFVNAVAKRHAEVSRRLLSLPTVSPITNGVHIETWAAKPWAELFDLHCAGWRRDNTNLRLAAGIPDSAIDHAHSACKQALQAELRARAIPFDDRHLTLGFARRATGYKRPELLLADPARLRRIAETYGPIQIVYSGKAHPHDHGGKELIQQVIRTLAAAGPGVTGAYLPDYDMRLAALLVAGCDVWVNTPLAPLEASGTSGMKAAANGVPSLSILDGWWLEGCIEGVTGWAIGPDRGVEPRDYNRPEDATFLLDKLEKDIAPRFARRPAEFTNMRRQCIAINASHFNTHRMLGDYVTQAYFR